MEQENIEIMAEETIDNILLEIEDNMTEIGYDAKFAGDYEHRNNSCKILSHVHAVLTGTKII